MQPYAELVHKYFPDDKIQSLPFYGMSGAYAVVEALRRTGAPPESIPFYDEHARVDPHHGRAWLDRVVAPLVGAHPDLGWRVGRGARWRSTVNARFLEAVLPMLGEDAHRSTAEGTPA